MTSGWGVDATKVNGVPVSGTSDLDVRKVWGALYTPGIISGSRVTTSGTALTYTISSGVVAIKTAEDEVVMAPVTGQTITVAAVTANRTDYIWVQQRFPTIEGDSQVSIGYGPLAPQRALVLAEYSLTAGATNTNQGIRTDSSLQFSIPYGSRLPRLHYWNNRYEGVLSTSLLREGHGSFYLPTDRYVKFSYSSVLSASGASGFDNTKYVEHGFLPNIDGGDFVLWTTPGLHQAWQSVYFERTLMLNAGYHTCHLGALRIVGPGLTVQHYGVDSAGFGRQGGEFSVEDAGPIA